MHSTATLGRPPRVSKVNVSQSYLETPARSNMSPISAPASHSDSFTRFDFSRTLSRSESKVMMRQGRQGSRSTNSSTRRKNSVSLFFSGGDGDVRTSGDHWQELLANPEIPGEILCRFLVASRCDSPFNCDFLFVTDDFLCFFPVGR